MNLTVTEVNSKIRDFLSQEFMNFILVGEVYDYKPSKSHWYFYLKDKTSILKVIVWQSKQKKQISNGELIEAYGSIDFYEKNGSVSFIIDKWDVLSTEGILRKEILKWEESYKSYFTPLNKCPNFFNSVVVITSNEGAALKDFLYVMKVGRFTGNVTILGCSVQGEKCVSDICNQVEKVLEISPQCVVITRGGGSLEDLISYSKPPVLEAIQTLKKQGIFTISAVGHESDTMLCDLVADCRCPTPSLAAEYIVSHNKKQALEIRGILDILKSKVLYHRKEVKEIKNMFLPNIFLYDLRLKLKHFISLKRNEITILKNKVLPLFTVEDSEGNVFGVEDMVNDMELYLCKGSRKVKVKVLLNSSPNKN